MRNPMPFCRKGDAHRPHRPAERNARNAQRGRSGVDGCHIVRVVLVCAHHETHDMHIVAKPLGEARAQRSVGEATSERGGIAGSPFTAEERAGYLARRIHALFHVHSQRKEVGPLAGVPRSRGGDEHFGVAYAADHRAVSQPRETTRLKADGLAFVPRDIGRHRNGLTALSRRASRRSFVLRSLSSVC